MLYKFYLFFFFQAEDGIRDVAVTGVQTCALPILVHLGSPAQRTEVNYVRVAPARCSRLRRATYAALTFIGILFVCAPLLEGGLGLLFFEVSSLVKVLDPSVQSSTEALTVRGHLIEALAFSAV